jgi:ectoine hydrolase
MLSFEIHEYKERPKKTKQKMLEHGIDVLLVTDPDNMNYLCRFRASV